MLAQDPNRTYPQDCYSGSPTWKQQPTDQARVDLRWPGWLASCLGLVEQSTACGFQADYHWTESRTENYSDEEISRSRCY